MAESEMRKVFCPVDGKLHWGNPKRNSDLYRCTKCGELHSKGDAK